MANLCQGRCKEDTLHQIGGNAVCGICSSGADPILGRRPPLGAPPKGLQGDLEANYIVSASHQSSGALRVDPGILGMLMSANLLRMASCSPWQSREEWGSFESDTQILGRPRRSSEHKRGRNGWRPTGLFFLRFHLYNEVYCLRAGGL